MVIYLQRGADLHMVKLMPLPLAVSCFINIQIGFTFLVPACLGSLGKKWPLNGCVCACVCFVAYSKQVFKYLLRGFPGLFTVISEHICFLLLVFFLFLRFLVVGSVR